MAYCAPPPFQSDGIPIIQYGLTCDERSLMQYSISLNITTTDTVCSKPEDVVTKVSQASIDICSCSECCIKIYLIDN